MAVLDAIKAVQDLTSVITGVKAAPDYPGGTAVFPLVVCHLAGGTVTPGDPAGAHRHPPR